MCVPLYAIQLSCLWLILQELDALAYEQPTEKERTELMNVCKELESDLDQCVQPVSLTQCCSDQYLESTMATGKRSSNQRAR